tara:strand:+ start:137 stop:664 length:528 start_codon:yes stop_codon:yes gene_type:complete
MNWEQNLVKKFNSTNHLKLLSQLKSELKAYPLKKKKNDYSQIQTKLKNESLIERNYLKQQKQRLDKVNNQTSTHLYKSNYNDNSTSEVNTSQEIFKSKHEEFNNHIKASSSSTQTNYKLDISDSRDSAIEAEKEKEIDSLTLSNKDNISNDRFVEIAVIDTPDSFKERLKNVDMR